MHIVNMSLLVLLVAFLVFLVVIAFKANRALNIWLAKNSDKD